MNSGGAFIISAIMGLGIPLIAVVFSVVLLIVKIIERYKICTILFIFVAQYVC